MTRVRGVADEKKGMSEKTECKKLGDGEENNQKKGVADSDTSIWKEKQRR